MHAPVGFVFDRNRHLASTRPGKSAAKEQIRLQQREWLARVMREAGETLSGIADKAGISDTTLTRFFNDERYHGTLSSPTVQAISNTFGIAGPGVLSNVHQIAREEARLLQDDDVDDILKRAIAGLIGDRAAARPWLMRSNALALAGVRPGDIMIIDAAEAAKDGDVVCAEIEAGVSARTVFRLYQTPNLVAASFDPAAVRPELVDGVRVRIAGVMTDLIRRRG
jgi:AcrR family transcriptional regulator